jgi:predicted transcriptional regulator
MTIEPAEIDWTPEGVTWSEVEMHRFMEAAELRTLARRLTKPRLTPRQLAKNSNVDIRTIYGFIEGTHTPRSTVLKRIQQAVDDELYGGPR